MKYQLGKFILPLCLLGLGISTVSAQDQTEQKPKSTFGLEDGTVVKLRLVRDLFSPDVKDEETIEIVLMSEKNPTRKCMTEK
jgi:hypothetical protein